MHFSVLVLTPTQDLQAAEPVAAAMLAPFDENLEVESYLADCWCVGSEAHREARASATAEAESLGINSLREELGAVRQEIRVAAGGEADAWQDARSTLDLIVDQDQRQALGSRLDILQERIEAIQTLTEIHLEQAEKRHPEYGKADPGCDVCEGTGLYFTDLNPQGQWDWWMVGGRWTGLLAKDYEPGSDPQNYHPCELCGQTGVRWWEEREEGEIPRSVGYPEFEGQETPWGAEAKTCNGCEGTGTARNFHNAPFSGDIAPVEKIVDRDNLGSSLAAVLTPDGKWHSHRNDSERDWQEEVGRLLAEHQQSVAVLVDCHC